MYDLVGSWSYGSVNVTSRDTVSGRYLTNDDSGDFVAVWDVPQYNEALIYHGYF